MSENENLSYRMLQKRDTDENWENSQFTPKSGEIVIFKENVDKNTPQRIRVGNDETLAKDLKNIVGEVYVQVDKPECAGDGAVWITPDEALDSGSSSGGTSDHSKLSNRDLPGQHPISAIDGLQEALDGKQPAGDYMTVEAIEIHNSDVNSHADIRDALANLSVGAGEVSRLDFSNFDPSLENPSFSETINGEIITHTVTFDSLGRPSKIDDCVIEWGDA